MEPSVHETDRLTLRKLHPDDAPFIFELLNCPSWIEFIGDRGIRSLQDAQRYIENGPMESYRLHGFGLYLTVARDANAPIGICGLVKREALPHPDIGFAFLPDYEGRGYAFESASCVVRHASVVLKLKKLLAITTAPNVRSQNLLKKLGLQFQEKIRFPGDEEELELFSINLE